MATKTIRWGGASITWHYFPSVNTASAKDLTGISGVTEAIAAEIIANRPFRDSMEIYHTVPAVSERLRRNIEQELNFE